MEFKRMSCQTPQEDSYLSLLHFSVRFSELSDQIMTSVWLAIFAIRTIIALPTYVSSQIRLSVYDILMWDSQRFQYSKRAWVVFLGDPFFFVVRFSRLRVPSRLLDFAHLFAHESRDSWVFVWTAGVYTFAHRKFFSCDAPTPWPHLSFPFSLFGLYLTCRPIWNLGR